MINYNELFEKSKELADIVVEIYNPDTSLLSMDEIEKTVKNGYNAVMKQKEKILAEAIINGWEINRII